MLTHLFGKPHMLRRVTVLVISEFVAGICVAILDQIGFGTDPCSVMNLAVSRTLGWSFGNYTLFFNALLLLIIFLLKEGRRIGLGTLANMVLIGYSADFATFLINRIHPIAPETLPVKIVIFIPTLLVFLTTVALYMVVDLGVAPYDAIPQIIAARQKRLSFTPVRILWDVAATLIGLLLGGVAGAVTILCCFFLGPVISWAARKLRRFFE